MNFWRMAVWLSPPFSGAFALRALGPTRPGGSESINFLKINPRFG